MYKIIGADQKEYGPISGEQIRQWMAEGRVNAQTSVCAEGSQEWKPLAMFPEFGSGNAPSTGAIPRSANPLTTEEILTRDYSLDIMGCVSKGWELLKDNFGVVFLTFLIVFVISAVAGGIIGGISGAIGGATHLNKSPIFQEFSRIVTSCLTALVVGPLTGGLYLVYIRLIRGEPTGISDVFAEFQTSFVQLSLGKLVTGLIAAVCMLPWSFTFNSKILAISEQAQHATPDKMGEFFSRLVSMFTDTLPVLLLCMIPVTYLSVNFMFTLPLIADRAMDFWPAMMLSWRMVHRHWFHLFGLAVIVGLLNFFGGLLCCIPFFFTAPIGIGAMMYAYETIFGRETA